MTKYTAHPQSESEAEAAAQQEANRRIAVDKAITASNRAGHKIGGREAHVIQALLTGRNK